MKILTYLILSLRNRNHAFLKLHVYNRHTIYKQTEITSSIWINIVLGTEFRLPGNLISGFARRNLIPVKYLKRHQFAKIMLVSLVVPGNLYRSAIYKTIESERCLESPYLFKNLLHLTISKRIVPKPVYTPIVLIQYIRPVSDKFLLCFII